MKAVPSRGLENISRSLLPSILARMPESQTGFALELSEDRLVGWALEQTRAARPVFAETD